MSEPYTGEIRMFGGNFAPSGWAFCSGQTMAISQNDTLFTLIGTTYGGDGQETFNLPDLQGRFPVHQGQGPGLSSRTIGETGGSEDVTLTVQQLPLHNHPPVAVSGSGNQRTPANGVWAASTANNFSMSPPVDALKSTLVQGSGGSQPHDNMMPYLTVSFIICLAGIFPVPG